MSDHIRRILLVLAIFVATGWFYKQWRDQHGGYGLFDALRGDPEPKGATVASTPRLTENDVPDLTRLSEESAKLAAAVLPSVVSINTEGQVPVNTLFGTYFKNQASLGSGVIVSKEGHVVTNYHVMANAQKGGIVTHDGKVHDVEVLGFDDELDIAVLRIKDAKNDFPALKFADSDKARTGEFVFAVGNPLGLSNSVTQGIISATERRRSDVMHDMIQTDTVINPGNSGGPLVNVRGEIVGINTAIERADTRVNAWQGVGLAVPANDVRAAFDAILTQRTQTGGYLGIGLEEKAVVVTVPTAPEKKFAGAVVEFVASSSPAEQAGLHTGDVIIQFDGRTFELPFQLMREMRRTRAGEVKTIEIIRGDRRMTLQAKFGARPKNR